YLLADLARKGFLPGYGFPTDVVAFDTTTKEEIELERKRKRSQREDASAGGDRDEPGGRWRGSPSRQLPLAIRDYAPGSSVVVDGKVYESQGVSLNWHIPPGKDPEKAVREIQAFRVAWRCRHCGASGSGPRRITRCPACGTAERELLRQHPYLQPAGFSVAF